ncbi:hypothetical protein BF49_2889 [Bradyrhizobium sp.]|nr:hypothetical protein BF49_2889 [Bradyrhizobium sp.]
MGVFRGFAAPKTGLRPTPRARGDHRALGQRDAQQARPFFVPKFHFGES